MDRASLQRAAAALQDTAGFGVFVRTLQEQLDSTIMRMLVSGCPDDTIITLRHEAFALKSLLESIIKNQK